MSLLVAAYFEKELSAEISSWKCAIDKVGEVVPNYDVKLGVILNAGLLP